LPRTKRFGKKKWIVVGFTVAVLVALVFSFLSLPSKPTPASWTVRFVEATTAHSLTASLGYYCPEWETSPERAENIFLLVEFGLEANSDAKPFSAQSILLVADGREFSPFCLPNIIGGSFENFSAYNYDTLHAVNFTLSYVDGVVSTSSLAVRNFSGRIAAEEVALEVAIEDGYGGYLTALSKINSTDALTYETGSITFVYVLPEAYLDGNHSFQLKIAGLVEGVKFTVKRP
jgi:hypothetical protein